MANSFIKVSVNSEKLVRVANAAITVVGYLVFFFAIEESFTVSVLPVNARLVAVVFGVSSADFRVSLP